MIWETFDDYDYNALSERAASIMLDAIRHDPRAVLGLPTGRTPIGMYARVVALCSREYHCFRDVTTFNLDEYAGIPSEHPGSYFTFMKRHLFDHVDLQPEHSHIPNGNAPDLAAECARYEREIADAGRLGLTFLGLGSNGHIAFNEPGTPFDSRTRVVALSESTRAANASFFADAPVPTHAITIGIGTILESREIVLLASGESKRNAVARLRSGEITTQFPASALWQHANVHVILDGGTVLAEVERGGCAPPPRSTAHVETSHHRDRQCSSRPHHRIQGASPSGPFLTRGDFIYTTAHPLPSVGEPRSVIESVIRIDGTMINVYVTHLTTWGPLKRKSRDQELVCLSKHVRTNHYPYLLLGDFNAPPDSPEVRHFEQLNAAQMCGEEIGPSHPLMNERIDYVWRTTAGKFVPRAC